MEALREVVVKSPNYTEFEGYFHQFGQMLKYDHNDNTFAVSSAIIERKDDGRIVEIEPGHVTFINH